MPDDPVIDASIKSGCLEKVLKPSITFRQNCLLCFSDDGLSVEFCNEGNVVSSRAYLSSEAFNEYYSKGVEFRVNIENIEAVLDNSSTDDEVVLEYYGDHRELQIRAGRQQYTLSVFANLEEQRYPEIDVDYITQVHLPSGEIITAVSAAVAFSDSIDITVDESEGKITFEADGDLNTTRRTVAGSEMDHDKIGSSENRYNLSLLDMIVNNIKSNSTVSLRLGQDDRPMRIDHTIANGDGSVRYEIAPQVTDQ